MRSDAAADVAATDALLRQVLDGVDAGICIVDADGRIVLYNKRLPEILGLPESLLAGRPSQDDVIRFQASRGDLDALGIDTEARMAQVASKIQKATEPFRYERTNRDGRIIEVLIHPLADGRQVRTFTDVTVVRAASQRLETAERLLAEILAGLDAEVTVFDADEIFVLGNQRFREGNPHLPPDADLLGKKFADIVRLSVAAGVAADPQAKKDPETYVARRTVEWREAREKRFEYHPASGRWHLVRTHRSPSGLTIQFVFDVSDQKRAEEELAAKSALLELALESMGDGLALYDKDINIIFHNRQMREFFGFPEELLRGKATAERMARFLAIRGRYGGGDPGVQVERVLAGFRKRDRHMYEHKLADGRTIEIHHNPQRDGTLIRRYVDVTDKKRMQEDLDAKASQLETTLDHMGDGIAVFDHDLNVVLHNRRLRDMFAIPEAVMQGKAIPAERILHAMAVKGQYGPGAPDEHAKRLMTELKNRTAATFEVVMPDGRTVAVHHIPLKDGGLVRRYVDLGARQKG